ncbi:succinate--CoA ligase subunit beta [Trichonephila clavata]|uniref:16S rRNA (uracil(1498)-N(3))-methyltransferase n=1 Tax=Trichonephila clavata TaxID=2740835 RepID=A0A8X6KNT1_TRICU|nr:succinate--CoA ligase subunit beta [Trichonephila clavata]
MVKSAALNNIVRQATEMGVICIQFISTERTVVKNINLSRAKLQAIEAAEQSGRISIPEILPPINFCELPDSRVKILFCVMKQSLIEVSVHYGDVDRALPVLKKTIQKEGRGLKMKKQYHEKKSEKELKRKLKREKEHQQECRRQRYGCAKSFVATSAEEVKTQVSQLKSDVFVVKAQIHAGGRGKAGGVKLASQMKKLNKIMELRDYDEEVKEEIEASKYGLSYIKMDGSIGCMVNGAGLAMQQWI